MRPDGEAMIVIGDNRMCVEGDYERIPTTDFVQDIAINCGMELIERIDISVTTENFVHIKNVITENVVLRLKIAQKRNNFRRNQISLYSYEQPVYTT